MRCVRDGPRAEASPGVDASVVVPFLNAESTVDHCLEGLLRQEWDRGRFEIIMVDNGSIDRSAEIVGRRPGVRLLREDRPGAYAARNRGIDAASGAIVAFTDADCVPKRDWLRRLVQALQEGPAQLVLGRVEPAGDSRWLALVERYEAVRNELLLRSPMPDRYYGYTNNMAVRRATFERIGPFPERRRGSDSVFVHRLIERSSCEAVAYCPAARVRHLEVGSLLDWYRKRFIYGRSAAANRDRLRLRPPSPATVGRALATLRRRSGMSVRELSFVGGLLLAGRAVHDLGRVSGLLRRPVDDDPRRDGLTRVGRPGC